MQNNILEYLEHTVKKVPNKIAYANEKVGITFKEVYDKGRAIGTFLNNQGFYKQPIAIFMTKHPNAVVAFLVPYIKATSMYL